MSGFPVIVNQDGTSHPTGSKGGFGATVNPPAGTPGYPDGAPLGLNNADTFDALVGAPIARQWQKVYLLSGAFTKSLPTTFPPSWTTFCGQGGKLIVCCKPPKAFSVDGDAAFTTFVDALQAQLGPNAYELVLWQEPNTHKSIESSTDTPFTAAQYRGYAQHYGNLFRAAAPGVALVYDPALCAPTDECNEDSVVSFFPGKAYADKILLDFYSTARRRGAWLSQIAAVADENAIPLGLGEFNAAASPYTFDRDEWETYCDDLSTFFRGRLAAGRDNAQIIFWMGGNANAPDLVVAGDPKLVGLKRLIRDLG